MTLREDFNTLQGRRCTAPTQDSTPDSCRGSRMFVLHIRVDTDGTTRRLSTRYETQTMTKFKLHKYTEECSHYFRMGHSVTQRSLGKKKKKPYKLDYIVKSFHTVV